MTVVTVFTILLLAACSTERSGDWGIDLIEPELIRTDEGLQVLAGIEIEPSPAMLEALDRGVAVTLAIQTRATPGRLWIPGFDRLRKHRLEISYLPLSRHYRLEYLRDGSHWTYPRLSMLIEDLRQRQPWSVKVDDEEFADVEWRVQARAELDRSRLPSPMRLPAWLDPQWRLRTAWQEWSTAGVDDDAA